MNLELTKNNHFKFGYDQQYFTFRQSPSQKWSIDYGSIQRQTVSWKTECQTAAQEIRNSTSQNIYICLSGGIDSIVTAESFRLADITFTAAIMRFKNKLNQHDIDWAEKYCKKFKIPIEYFEVDPMSFYKTAEFDKIVESTQCFFPLLSLQMKLMEWVANKNGFPVVGSAEYYLEKQNNHQWVMYEREIYASLYRHQMLKNFKGVCGFFQWSPELMYSFLVDTKVQKLVQNEFPNVNSTLEIKHEIYTQHFDIEPRPKYYGWENFSEEERILRLKLFHRFAFAQGEVKTPYQDVLQMLDIINQGSRL